MLVLLAKIRPPISSLRHKYQVKIQFYLPWPIAALAMLLGLPTSGSAQILQTADDFAILSGTGNVTNTGSTVIDGNVGSSTTVSGFPPGTITVDGSPAMPIIGGTTQQAESDLIEAAHGLSGMAPTVDETGIDLGDQALLPGVYFFASTAQLTGVLTLNANGQSNAYWVFQITSSLTTSSDSAVVLENAPDSGSGVGIYWDAKAAITIGTDSTILGNYLAGTSITFDGNDNGNLGSRLLAQAAVTISTASSLNSTGDASQDGYDAALMYIGGGQVGPSIVVPEPVAFLWLAPLGAMGYALWRRRLAQGYGSI
jgi:hypothetical protein